jgi:hypothetical protein
LPDSPVLTPDSLDAGFLLEMPEHGDGRNRIVTPAHLPAKNYINPSPNSNGTDCEIASEIDIQLHPWLLFLN